MKIDVFNDATLSESIGEVRALYAKHRRLKVTIHAGKRSLDHNAISHIWYAQVANELRENTPEGVHCECKLRFGVPILRAEDDDFRAFYDRAIGQHLQIGVATMDLLREEGPRLHSRKLRSFDEPPFR